jgi:predicted RND superfamily exporter protein
VLKQKHILALYDAEAAVTEITTVRPSATYSYFGNRDGTEGTISLCYLQYPPRGGETPLDVPCLTRTVQSVFKTAPSTCDAWNTACDENYIPSDSCRNFYENVLTDALLITAIEEYETIVAAQGGVPISAFIGEIERDVNSNAVEKATALLTTFAITAEYEIADENDALFAYDIEDSEAWQDEFIDIVEAENFNDVGIVSNSQFYRYTTVTTLREVDRARDSTTQLVIISVILIMIFLCVTFFDSDKVQSQMLLAILGIIVILVAAFTGFGLSLWFGIKETPITQVITFLVLGLGVANYVIIIEAFDGTDVNDSLQKRNAEAIAHAGAFVTLTNGTTIVAFLVGSNSVFPAVEYFAFCAAIVIFLNVVYNMTLWNALMVLMMRRAADNRLDCLICVKSSTPLKPLMNASDEAPTGYMNIFIKGKLAPMFLQRWFRLALAAMFFTITCIGIYFATTLGEGLDLKDTVPDDSYFSEFFGLTSDYFQDYGPRINVVIEENIADPVYFCSTEERERIEEFKTSIENLPRTSTEEVVFVLDYYERFLDIAPPPPGSPTFFEDCKPRPLADIDSCSFYTACFESFFAQPQFATFAYDIDFYDPETQPQLAAEYGIRTVKMQTFHIATMKSSTELQDALDEIRAVTNNNNLGAPAFAFAQDYLIWDSFSEVFGEMVTNLVISCICVFFVLLLLLHPILSLLVVTVIIIMDVLILAWIPIMGLELNSVTTICIVMSVGIAVDYSAHIAHSYQVNSGTKPERAAKAVSDMGRAILSGGFAAFLGVLMLAFDNTEVKRVFFTMLAGILSIGMLHGLLLLPVLLSFFGPTYYFPMMHGSGEAHHDDGHNDAISMPLKH